MAALSEMRSPRTVDLRHLRPGDLDNVLEEEVRSWRDLLDWDFQPSADLVRRFVQMQALSGFSLMLGNELIGYAYYVCEERKGLIGDLYVLREFRQPENENLLLEAVLNALTDTPFVRRVESQLMMIDSPLKRTIPQSHRVQVYPRCFMEAELAPISTLPPRFSPRAHFETWSERSQEDVAQLIASSYRNHVDAKINDQYRSPAGARRFLLNIVQYPGCGTFFQPASFVAIDTASSRLIGTCLASLVNADIGHITQICVGPDTQGTGVGYELLRRSLLALFECGCRRVSLTVTMANEQAIRLYENTGFKTRLQFAAYVWE